MQSWRDLLKPTEVGRLGALVGLMGAATGGLLWLFVFLNEAPMGLLYADLAPEDAARITERLDQAGVPYRQKGNGSVIYVPKDKVFSLRMELAADGVPSKGIVGYELFDNADAFGTTSFVQNINRLRALEGELARTIMSLEAVESARVHLVLPERELFSRTEASPSASIVVKARRGSLERDQVAAIQYLVASAVRGLTPQRVSIVDERGMLLASGNDEGTPAAIGASLDARRSAFEARLGAEVERLVASIVGVGNVRVQVAAEMDFNRIVTESEIYDPERQVIVSSQTIEESESASDREKSGAVSVSTELPDGGQEGEAQGSRSASSRTEERVNYQNSLTKQTLVQEGGRVTRLSVAVVVNDVESAGADGGATYAPRSQEEMARISALVRSAIGYDEKRGDQVEIANIRFTRLATSLEDAASEKAGFEIADYLPYAEKAILVIVALVLVFFLFRPLITRLLQASGASGMSALPAGAPTQGQIAAAGQPGALPGPGGEALPAPKQTAIERGIDIAHIQGQVKESSVRKVGELIHQHPEESMSILRNWLYETG